MTRARIALCAVYGAIAAVALVATWSQNLAYFGSIADFGPALGAFLNDTKVTPAARSVTVDIALFFLAAAIFMIVEARRLGVRFVWLYVLGGLFIAISVTFPLFMIARELKLPESDAKYLHAIDLVPLAAFGALILGLTLWVDRAL